MSDDRRVANVCACACVHVKLASFLFQTRVILMQRRDGQLFKMFFAEAFFYLHIINSYEEDNHLVIDICCYKDATMLDCMYVDALMVILYIETRSIFCKFQHISHKVVCLIILSTSAC
jgi:hypothetical protein